MTSGLISIVCPVFNDAEAVPLFHARLAAVLAPLEAKYRFELIFSNDGSTDETLPAIRRLCDTDPRVHVLTLARNFGYEVAIAAGMKHARGEAIISIDVDCEDPPEMIPDFIAHWREGFDVVYGRRGRRPEPILWQASRKIFYRLNRLIADSEIVLDMGNFFLITAPVRDAILSQNSTLPFLRSEIAYVGFRRRGIPYARQPRVAGASHYNVWRATKFAVRGILSSTTFPLRLAIWSFPFLVVATVVLRVVGSLADLVMVNLLYIAFFIAMICIYLARTYKDVVQRPPYVIDWTASHYPDAR